MAKKKEVYQVTKNGPSLCGIGIRSTGSFQSCTKDGCLSEAPYKTARSHISVRFR